mmetsp:Transcript_18894/g.42643  ORF Transcript_18894/g.42643 Transcript_18894/m.42643 type:complete len:313 (+) Transcript_18894:39-977(+)
MEDMGSFQLQLRIFAAAVPSLTPSSRWANWARRPRVEVSLGEMQETEAAVWNEKASSSRGSCWIPSGQECPWRFNDEITFRTSVDELEMQSALHFRLCVQSDISLGVVSVKLPADVLGVATADLLRHVLPICTVGQPTDWFRFQSTVQMVTLRTMDANEVGSIALQFALDADPKELLAAASITAAARPLLRKQLEAMPPWWLDCCSSDRGRRLCSEECGEDGPDDAALNPPSLPTLLRRPEPPSLPAPEHAPDGWICRRGPGGRIFWHHKALGPAPWEDVPCGLKNNRAFYRSIMGKVADLSDLPQSSDSML